MKKMHVYEVIVDNPKTGLSKQFMMATSMKDLKMKFENQNELVRVENVSDSYKFTPESIEKLKKDLSKTGWNEIYINLIINALHSACPNLFDGSDDEEDENAD